jgi:hypothetical protein
MMFRDLLRSGWLLPLFFPNLASANFTMSAPRRSSKTYKPNGKREVARRLRQIEAGTLRRENGLAA